MTTFQLTDVSIFVIATNAYVDYAINLINSSTSWLEAKTRVQVLLLTDVVIDVNRFCSNENEVTVNSFRIPSYGWPEATLLRFHLMLDHWEHVTGEIVMYLDADTEIVSPLNFADLHKISTASGSNGLTPVLHPGYFNRSRLRNAFNRTRFGPWEHRKISTAYVPANLRKKYVCGGVIWGLKDSFLKLCTDLKASIDLDLKHKITAKHNDESHLNKWFVSNNTVAATPEWAYAVGYSNLNGLNPRIEVIHKPSTFVRTPTKLN